MSLDYAKFLGVLNDIQRKPFFRALGRRFAREAARAYLDAGGVVDEAGNRQEADGGVVETLLMNRADFGLQVVFAWQREVAAMARREGTAVPSPHQQLTPEQAADLEVALDAMTSSIMEGWQSEDVPVIRGLHPDALLVVPLYRSALVVERQDEADAERGAVRLFVYHDPGWIGEDVDAESMARHRWEVRLLGQRDGPNVLHRPACDCSSLAGRLADLPAERKRVRA